MTAIGTVVAYNSVAVHTLITRTIQKIGFVEGQTGQRVAVMLGFKRFRNAAIKIAGIELMHRTRRGQFALGHLGFQGRTAPTVWDAVLGS